jgi:hypothetical protein
MMRTLVAFLHVAPLFAAPLAMPSREPVQHWVAAPLAGASVAPAFNVSTGFQIATQGARVLRTEFPLSSVMSLPELSLQLHAAPRSEEVEAGAQPRYAVLTVSSHGAQNPSSFLLVNARDEATWKRLGAPLLRRRSKRATAPSELGSGTNPPPPPARLDLGVLALGKLVARA